MWSQDQKPGWQQLALPINPPPKNKKNAEIWKDKTQAAKHSPQPKAGERCNLPVVQKSLESWCFLKGHRANICTSNKRQCTCYYMSEMPDLPNGITYTINPGERALSLPDWQVWWQPALGTKWGSRSPSKSPGEKGERPLFWENSVQDPSKFHSAYLRMAVLILGGHSTEILA